MMPPPHEVLGIGRTATVEEAKSAYRHLAKIHHPDISDEPDAEEKFRAIKDAFELFKSRAIVEAPIPERARNEWTDPPVRQPHTYKAGKKNTYLATATIGNEILRTGPSTFKGQLNIPRKIIDEGGTVTVMMYAEYGSYVFPRAGEPSINHVFKFDVLPGFPEVNLTVKGHYVIDLTLIPS